MIARVAIAFAMLAPSAARADCVSCHETRPEERLRAPIALVAGDVHGANDVACVSCHGGDAEQSTMRAHDPAHGFRGRARGLEAVLLCRGCHEEIARDVRAGSHGRALEADRSAASCTDCHGAHGVEVPDPVEACATCHADQSDEWTSSVHGLARIAGNAGAPACASCHDPHRAESGLAPSAACASCHAPIREAFDRGPHAQRFAELGFLDCVECHGSHEIRPVDAALLRGVTSVCARCHAEGTETFERVRALVAQAPHVEAARALARDDPRRIEVIQALHALDAAAIASVDVPTPRPPAIEPPPAPRSILELVWAVLAAVGALAVVLLLHRLVRRR